MNMLKGECTGYGSETLLERIGNTPLLALRSLFTEFAASVYAKAEWFNPGGSVKDRAALRIILAAEKEGMMKPGRTLIDASSGNTAIAYAMICAARGYRCKMVIPSNVSPEKIRILKAYGAEVVFSSPLEGTDGAQRMARRIAEENPDLYFYADQYNNENNWRAHYETTGREIIRQMDTHPDYFVAGIGTGGTLMGTGRLLREKVEGIRIAAVEPDVPLHGIEGLKRMDSSIRPGIYDEGFPDMHIYISTREAQRMVFEAARKEGILLGPSSGAALAACRNILMEEDAHSIVTVLPDGGQRYINEKFWEELL